MLVSKSVFVSLPTYMPIISKIYENTFIKTFFLFSYVTLE